MAMTRGFYFAIGWTIFCFIALYFILDICAVFIGFLEYSYYTINSIGEDLKQYIKWCFFKIKIFKRNLFNERANDNINNTNNINRTHENPYETYRNTKAELFAQDTDNDEDDAVSTSLPSYHSASTNPNPNINLNEPSSSMSIPECELPTYPAPLYTR